MENDVVVTNDGIATIFDAAFKENTTFLTSEICDLTAVNSVAVAAIDLTDGNFHKFPMVAVTLEA